MKNSKLYADNKDRGHNLTDADRSKGGKHSHEDQQKHSSKKEDNKSSRSNQDNSKKSSQ